jgi:hypothetical protein
MRKLALLIALCTAGCPGLGQVAFDVQSSGSSTVQGSALGGAFSNNNTNKDHLSSARVSRLTIAPYAKADSFSITTKGTGTQPPQNTTVEADLSLHIVANVL